LGVEKVIATINGLRILFLAYSVDRLITALLLLLLLLLLMMMMMMMMMMLVGMV